MYTLVCQGSCMPASSTVVWSNTQPHTFLLAVLIAKDSLLSNLGYLDKISYMLQI